MLGKLCSPEDVAVLEQTVQNAVELADAGLDQIRDKLSATSYLDFPKQVAIDFFGPESKNIAEQARIVGKFPL